MERNWFFFVKYQRISLGFLNINQNKYKMWNILRITGIYTYETPVSPGCEKVKHYAKNDCAKRISSRDINNKLNTWSTENWFPYTVYSWSLVYPFNIFLRRTQNIWSGWWIYLMLDRSFVSVPDVLLFFFFFIVFPILKIYI